MLRFLENTKFQSKHAFHTFSWDLPVVLLTNTLHAFFALFVSQTGQAVSMHANPSTKSVPFALSNFRVASKENSFGFSSPPIVQYCRPIDVGGGGDLIETKRWSPNWICFFLANKCLVTALKYILQWNTCLWDARFCGSVVEALYLNGFSLVFPVGRLGNALYLATNKNKTFRKGKQKQRKLLSQVMVKVDTARESRFSFFTN